MSAHMQLCYGDLTGIVILGVYLVVVIVYQSWVAVVKYLGLIWRWGTQRVFVIALNKCLL